MKFEGDVWSPNVNEGSREHRQFSVSAESLVPVSQHLIGDLAQSVVTTVVPQRVELGVRRVEPTTERLPVVNYVVRD